MFTLSTPKKGYKKSGDLDYFRNVQAMQACIKDGGKQNIKKVGKKNCLNKTHTLRHVLGSNPGGRFPLGIGSICKMERRKEKRNKNKEKKLPSLSATNDYIHPMVKKNYLKRKKKATSQMLDYHYWQQKKRKNNRKRNTKPHSFILINL